MGNFNKENENGRALDEGISLPQFFQVHRL